MTFLEATEHKQLPWRKLEIIRIPGSFTESLLSFTVCASTRCMVDLLPYVLRACLLCGTRPGAKMTLTGSLSSYSIHDFLRTPPPYLALPIMLKATTHPWLFTVTGMS